MFFPLKDFRECGGVNEKLHFSMDRDLYCRLLQILNPIYLDIAAVKYRLHDKAKSVYFGGYSWIENRKIFKKYVKEQSNNIDLNEAKRIFFTGCVDRAMTSFRKKWYKIGVLMLIGGFRENPFNMMMELIKKIIKKIN